MFRFFVYKRKENESFHVKLSKKEQNVLTIF